MHYYLGVDIGSVSSNFVLLDDNNQIKTKIYMRTNGNPVQAIKDGYAIIKEQIEDVKQIKRGRYNWQWPQLASIIFRSRCSKMK